MYVHLKYEASTIASSVSAIGQAVDVKEVGHFNIQGTMRYKVFISTIIFSQINGNSHSNTKDLLPKFPLDDFRVPRNGIETISDECLKAGDEYLELLGKS